MIAAMVLMLLIGRFSVPGAAGGTTAPASPKPGAGGGGSATPAPPSGDAPWALSAVPGCFRQLRSVEGSPAHVRPYAAEILRGARPLVPGRLTSGSCVLIVGTNRARLVRDDVRLEIPPVARFYVAGKRLVLDRVAGDREEIRVYCPVVHPPGYGVLSC